MSIEAMNWAFNAPVQPSGAKFVLVVLADHADKAGYCYPGQELIAAKTGQTGRSVRAHLARLEADGWIARTKRRARGKQTSDGYNLNLEATGSSPGAPVDNPAPPENSSARNEASQPEKNVVSGGKKCRSQPEEFSAEPSVNQKEPKTRAREGCAGDCAPARAENEVDGGSPCAAAPPTPRTAKQESASKGPGGREGEAPEPKPIPACRVWDEAADRIALTIAGPLARYCIPDGDDGETLTLAVGQAGIGYAVLAWAAPLIEPLVGRRIACVVRSWVPPALLKKGLDRESRLSRTARGWDAVQPRLDDRAWGLWQAARAAGAFETCQGYAEGALPDGFDAEGALVVKVARAALMLDGAGEGALSDALGVPVRLSLGGWVDDALDVRRKYERMRAARDKGESAA